MTIRIPGMQRVQALGGISRSALCCHSNETRAPIANPPNNAQLQGTFYHSPSYIRVRAVVWECGEGQTDRLTDTQMAVTNIHFASATPHAKCTNDVFCNTTDRLFVTVDSPCTAINLLILREKFTPWHYEKAIQPG